MKPYVVSCYVPAGLGDRTESQSFNTLAYAQTYADLQEETGLWLTITISHELEVRNLGGKSHAL